MFCIVFIFRLSKSEGKVKDDDKSVRNADNKKAKRRIKEAQKLLQEIPLETDHSVIALLTEHITQLCKRLMQITISISSGKFSEHEKHVNEKSGSDSDDAKRNRSVECGRASTHIYDEIGHVADSPYLRPKHRLSHESDTTPTPPLLANISPRQISRLNSVHLFSSESDSSDFESNIVVPFNSERRDRSSQTKRSRQADKRREKKYIRSSRSPKSPVNDDYGFKSHVLSSFEKRKAIVINDNELNHTGDVSESSVQSKHPSLQEPINQYLRKMTPPPTMTEVLQQHHHDSAKYIRSTPKRLLPATPKVTEDAPDGSLPLHRNYQTVIKSQHKAGSVQHNGSDVTSETVSLDSDELEFRNSVRTANKEIIEKLKRRFNSGSSYLSDCSHDDMSDSHASTDFNTEHREWNNTIPRTSRPMHSADNQLHATHQPQGIFRGKLIQVCDVLPPRPLHRQDSIVSSNIKKFENNIWQTELSDFKAKGRKGHKYNAGIRFRSTSEPRTSVANLRNQQNIDRTRITNNALKPRNESGYSTLTESEKDKSQDSANESHNSMLLKSCTENDLNELVEQKSTKLIRRQWSQRRSSSLNARVPTSTQKVYKQGPVFELSTTFTVPDHVTRCHAAAMAVLDTGHIVVLDERHFYIHLFESGTFNHLQELKLYDIPRSCQKIASCQIAIALPYKKVVSVYDIDRNQIKLADTISIQCNEWILDISVAAGCIHALCKTGHIHIVSKTGSELKCLPVGMSGRLFVEPSGKRLYITGGRKVHKFDMDGKLLSTKCDIDTYSMLYLDNRVYVADRLKQRIRPLTDVLDIQDLTESKLEYPSAMCISATGNTLFVSQYDESIDIVNARTVSVFKLKEIVTHV